MGWSMTVGVRGYSQTTKSVDFVFGSFGTCVCVCVCVCVCGLVNHVGTVKETDELKILRH